jgi:hypothetical protein
VGDGKVSFRNVMGIMREWVKGGGGGK